MKAFFFDTYAFFEMLKGNEKYAPYAHGVSIMTTKLNLLELHHGLRCRQGRRIADQRFDEFSMLALPIDNDVLKQSSELRAQLKQRKLSYIDCIGYVVALANNLKFLTGDQQFEDLPGVEFVK